MDKRLFLTLAIVVVGLVLSVGFKYLIYQGVPEEHDMGDNLRDSGTKSQKSKADSSGSGSEKSKSSQKGADESAEGSSLSSKEAAIYKDIQKKTRIKVLYPSYIPDGYEQSEELADQPDTSNPDILDAGFMISYEKGDSYFKIVEGSIFDIGEPANPESATVNGEKATVDKYEDSVSVYWLEDNVSYLITGEKISSDEILNVANGMEKLKD